MSCPSSALVAGEKIGRSSRRAFHQALGQRLARQGAVVAILGPGRSADVAPDHALERRPAAVRRHSMARPTSWSRCPTRAGTRAMISSGVRGDEVRRDRVPQLAEPEGADLGQHRAFSRDRLGHHHVEGAHPVAGDQQQVRGIHLVDLADLAAAEEGEGQGTPGQTLVIRSPGRRRAPRPAGGPAPGAGEGTPRETRPPARWRGRCSGRDPVRPAASRPGPGRRRDPSPSRCSRSLGSPRLTASAADQAVPPDHFVQLLAVAAGGHAQHAASARWP